MAFTTGLAILLAAGRFLSPFFGGIGGSFFQIGILVLVYSVTGVINMWALLSREISALRIAVAVTIGMGSGCVAGFLQGEPFFWPGTTLVQTVVLMSSLWFLRTMGLRLVSSSEAF